jgi:hypothetical protein
VNKAGEIRKRFLLETYGIERTSLMKKKKYQISVILLAPPSINSNNETVRMIIRRNDSLKLECPASGYPIPIIRW